MDTTFIAEPIVSIDEKLLGVELLTRFISPDGRPLHPEFVISSWDLDRKRLFLYEQCGNIASMQKWFERKNLFCTLNIDQQMAFLIRHDYILRQTFESMPFIKLELSDAGGSGLNMASVIFKVNNVQVTQGVSWADQGGKKVCTYHATNLSDGSNSVSLQVTDNDGNVSDAATVSFVISTSAPTLNVTSPQDNLLTNSNRVTVAGTAAAGSDAVTLTRRGV